MEGKVTMPTLDKHERKQLRKAMTAAETRFREVGLRSDTHIFDLMVTAKRRERAFVEVHEYLAARHAVLCVHGRACDGSCNDYGCP